jgi:hypothetical protein
VTHRKEVRCVSTWQLGYLNTIAKRKLEKLDTIVFFLCSWTPIEKFVTRSTLLFNSYGFSVLNANPQQIGPFISTHVQIACKFALFRHSLEDFYTSYGRRTYIPMYDCLSFKIQSQSCKKWQKVTAWTTLHISGFESNRLLVFTFIEIDFSAFYSATEIGRAASFFNFGTGLPDGTYIFKPKIPNWVNFGGSCNGKCWYILWHWVYFYGHLVEFLPIWCILW